MFSLTSTEHGGRVLYLERERVLTTTRMAMTNAAADDDDDDDDADVGDDVEEDAEDADDADDEDGDGGGGGGGSGGGKITTWLSSPFSERKEGRRGAEEKRRRGRGEGAC